MRNDVRLRPAMASKNDTLACWKCGTEAPWAPDCSSCGALRRCPKTIDCFSLFSLPRSPEVDLTALQARYYKLSRKFHPDLYHGASPEERAASLENSALLNRAYRTLKDPYQRGLYWLELHGERLGRDNNRVPPRLAARVFEVQERLEELRAQRNEGSTRGGIREIAREIRDELSGYGERLAVNFHRFAAEGDGSGELLAELKIILSERAYLKTLLRDVEKELDDSWNGSSAST